MTITQAPRRGRRQLREAIPEIAEVAGYLNEAVSAHLAGNAALVETLVARADLPAIRVWCESLWGKDSPHVQYMPIQGAPVGIDKSLRPVLRMPLLATRRELIQRDGYHCRFCGIPVIRSEIRRRIAAAYPQLKIWGRRNAEQHAAFQTMWLQYDHVVPYTRGGSNELDNLVVTCAPCNFARMEYTLEEVGLADPRTRPPIKSQWDGLERFR